MCREANMSDGVFPPRTAANATVVFAIILKGKKVNGELGWDPVDWW